MTSLLLKNFLNPHYFGKNLLMGLNLHKGELLVILMTQSCIFLFNFKVGMYAHLSLSLNKKFCGFFSHSFNMVTDRISVRVNVS